MTAEQLKKSVAASLEELLTVKGTKYDTIDAYGVTVRLGTLSSLDLVEWLGENEDKEKQEVAGLRILVKALVDADGNRVPEEKREDYIKAFRNKDNTDNNRVIRKVLEMNGLRAPEKAGDPELTTAIKND